MRTRHTHLGARPVIPANSSLLESQMRLAVAITSCVLLVHCATGVSLAQDKLTFEQHVRPILKAYCLDCHGAGEKMPGKLDLRLRRFAVEGGKSGPAGVPKHPGESLLLERMKSGEMPPVGKKVPAEQIAVVEKWIAAG